MSSNDVSTRSFDSIMTSANNSITGSDGGEETLHLKSLKEFIVKLKSATNNILASGSQRYSKVTALVTCWPDSLSDRGHIRTSAKELCKVFKDEYHFDVNEKPYEIPQRGSHLAFSKKLFQSLDKVTMDKPPERPEDRTNLFILYYGGHAVEKDNTMEWRPREHAETLTFVKWTSILDNFTDINCDLLFLFDCCYAGDMVDFGREFNQRCEVLCASNRNEKASGEESHSFTRALVGELRLEAELRRGCEIKRLHSRLNLESRKKNYKLEVDPYWEQFTLRRKSSICIAPLGGTQARSSTSDSTAQDLNELFGARVLFKATFEDPTNLPILDEWAEFVNWRPGNVRSIDWVALRETCVHNLFKTNSSSAIMSIPMILWDSMPKTSAYEFICVIRSSDLLGGLPRRNRATSGPLYEHSVADYDYIENSVPASPADVASGSGVGVDSAGVEVINIANPPIRTQWSTTTAMAYQQEIDIANRIRRPVAYAEWAYHNDRQFRYHAYELEGRPISARYFQDKGSILWNVIRWNTHVHLGFRDGKILVLAFRGTDFPLTVQNWAKIKRWWGLCGNALTDLSFGTSSIEWDGAANLRDVRVHTGFLVAFNNLRDKLALRINRLMEGQQPSDIEVCGHSLGGALATLCALWCKTRWPNANVTCVTIGSPRVGDARFVERFRELRICSYRIMMDSDPIPTLPNRYTETFPIRISTTPPYFRVCCSTTRYRHVGNPFWIHKIPEGFEIRQYNPPYIGDEETAADLSPIVNIGLRWGGIILYACFRALWLLWNIWAHMPTRYPTALQYIVDDILPTLDVERTEQQEGKEGE